MREELQVLENYIKTQELRNTPQRNKILEIFLQHEEHISAEELYALVRKQYPEIGQSTVFRNMKIFCEAGLAEKIQNENGVIEYEHAYKHKKHNHLVCAQCGKLEEFDEPQLTKLQNKIAKAHNFKVDSLTIKITGLCRACSKKRAN